jgi:hypothetical protein
MDGGPEAPIRRHEINSSIVREPKVCGVIHGTAVAACRRNRSSGRNVDKFDLKTLNMVEDDIDRLRR